MNHLYHNNGNKQMSELGSDTTSVVLRNDEIKSVTYGDTIDRRGVKMRKVTRVKLVPRRTFIKGTLKGKYWGDQEIRDASPKDIGQFYNITLYESEISVDREVIRTEGSTTFSDFLTEISRANSFTSYHHIDPSQLKNNFLVVHHEGSVNRYKIDLHEPRLYNAKIVHALHQSSDHEVFGSIESNICGYLLDKKEVIEESYEVIEDILISSPAPAPQKPATGIKINSITKLEGKGTNEYDDKSGQEERRDPDRDRQKSWLDRWSFLPLFLIFLLCLVALASSISNSLWILPIAALLFFAFQKPGFKLPNWVYYLLFLFLGLVLWNAFRTSQVAASNPITNFIDKNFGNGKSNEIGSVDKSVEHSKSVKGKSGTNASDESRKIDEANSAGRKKGPQPIEPTSIAPEEITQPNETGSESETPTRISKSVSFNTYIAKGLKAVEDEEYTLANRNFRQAANLEPSNPKLKQLADRYKKLADEKCQDFRNANAKELMHIPNNYYQYAASLTQTAPLKCE